MIEPAGIATRISFMPPSINVPEARDPAGQRSGERKIDIVMSIADEIETDIIEYIGAHYGVEPDEITDESTLEDLGLDSLGVLAIADIVENKYGISLDDQRIARGRTIFVLQ